MAQAFVIKSIDSATASVCRDRERLKPLKVPERRRAWVRLAVVLTVLAFTIWAVEYIALNSSGYHYKEVAYNSTEAQPYFLPVPAGSFIAASNSSYADGMIPQNISCTCLGKASMSWCSFIDFYLLTCDQATNYILNVTTISTSNSTSCHQRPNIDRACPNARNPQNCSIALDTVYDFPARTTYIETPNVASPFQVFDFVSTTMQSNIHIINQTIDYSLNPNNQKYNHSILVLSLLQSMLAQMFDCDTSSTMQQFWDRANECVWNLYPQIAVEFNGSKFAFGMKMNYDAYITTCKPGTCYILVKDGFSTRLVRAIGQVGGVGSIILLGIQVVLWPVVARIFKFPTPGHIQVSTMANAIEGLGDN